MSKSNHFELVEYSPHKANFEELIIILSNIWFWCNNIILKFL